MQNYAWAKSHEAGLSVAVVMGYQALL